MTTYTVIGLHDDTGQVFVDYAKANDPHAAMLLIASSENAPSQILGAIAGIHRIVTACEDAGKAAYREDLVCG